MRSAVVAQAAEILGGVGAVDGRADALSWCKIDALAGNMRELGVLALEPHFRQPARWSKNSGVQIALQAIPKLNEDLEPYVLLPKTPKPHQNRN